MDAFEVFEHAGLTVELHYDEEPCSPREWENASVMVCWHPDYALGDFQVTNLDGRGAVETRFERDDFRDLETLGRWLRLALGADVVLPLYLLDHSGLSIRAGSTFESDAQGWDTTMVGFVYSSPAVRETCGTPDELAEKVCRGDVADYDNYLRGNVHGFVVRDGDTVLDSRWGFYPGEWRPGDDGLEDVRAEARAAAESQRATLDERARDDRLDGGFPDVALALAGEGVAS